MIWLLAAQATAKGDRVINQDAAHVSEHLCVVADGLGGHNAGEVASALAVEALVEARNTAVVSRQATKSGGRLRQNVPLLPSIDELLGAVAEANRRVWDKSWSIVELKGMCTTLCVLAVVEKDAKELLAVVNIGDSRAYRCDEAGLWQLTQDHTARQEAIKAGVDLALLKANDLSKLSRTVGYEENVMADDWMFDPVYGHRYLLCSDGLTNAVTDSTIHSVLLECADPQETANALVVKALDCFAADNITVLVADVKETQMISDPNVEKAR